MTDINISALQAYAQSQAKAARAKAIEQAEEIEFQIETVLRILKRPEPHVAANVCTNALQELQYQLALLTERVRFLRMLGSDIEPYPQQQEERAADCQWQSIADAPVGDLLELTMQSRGADSEYDMRGFGKVSQPLNKKHLSSDESCWANMSVQAAVEARVMWRRPSPAPGKG